ncbi:unnamed protein product [Cylindrotheca closterium]|uniref:Uncharacterized protein n=1 Tax=Cylindrotheca closterium TaxID=2856 RepID=A0AAD2PWT3_9STRA|nr:unnamed protein product [Cylindrotheca closterium]
MPPAAAIVDCESVECIHDVGGIEVEHIALPGGRSRHTKITASPRDFIIEEERRRFAYLQSMTVGLTGMAYSFDSVDEIDEDSNEAKLIKSIAQRAIVAADDAPMPHETEARYLEVLDRHIEKTEPDLSSFAALEGDIDDVHPHKNRARVDEIMEHLIDSSCCQCSTSGPVHRPLRSALKSPKWSDPGMYHASATDNRSKLYSVTFQNVDIQEFSMTLGDHPAACSGPPVRLDWDVSLKFYEINLEEYENLRLPRRNRKELKLSLQQRHNILVKERGFSFEEVKGAWHDALEIRRQRKETLERGLALMKWDEVWESTCRKFTRLVDY